MHRPTTEARIHEVHTRLRGYGDFVNLGEAARLLGLSYNVVRAAILVGHDRGWYEVRESQTKRSPRTGQPATEYRATTRTQL